MRGAGLKMGAACRALRALASLEAGPSREEPSQARHALLTLQGRGGPCQAPLARASWTVAPNPGNPCRALHLPMDRL